MKAPFAFPIIPFVAFAATFVPAGAQTAAPLHPTLHHTVMAGYQGWFRAQGDGSNQGWFHYAANSASSPLQSPPANLNIDYWPDVSEMTKTYYADSSKSWPLVSAYDESTVATHFQWMQTYGIDGVFVQRFAQVVIPGSPDTDFVLQSAASNAQKTGRSFAVMYDLTNMPAGQIASVISDWQHVVDKLQVRNSPAYQYHGGKPVVGVYGIGFQNTAQDQYPPLADALQLLTFLNSDPKYGGNCIVAGVPRAWLRSQTTRVFPGENDATAAIGPPSLLTVLAQASVIMPWSVNRFNDLGSARVNAEEYWRPELAWCAAHNLEYLPVAFPGFSNQNQTLNNSGGKIPGSTVDRVAGRLLWEQYRLAADLGCTMVYQAMFDEMDEGTQIFKVSATPPAPAKNSPLLIYDAPLPDGTSFLLPNDYYLTVAGVATALFHQTPIAQPFPSRIPSLTFSGLNALMTDGVNNYLRQTNDSVYQAAAASYSTNKAIAYYMPLLASWLAYWPTPATGTSAASPWMPVDSLPRGTYVQLSGNWPARPIKSADPHASITWQLPVPATGNYQVSIRYPGPSQNSYASNAQVTVAQPTPLAQAFFPVNLRSNTQTWNNLGVMNLTTGAPCQVTLSNSSSAITGPITFFEARLVPVSAP